MTAFAVPLYTYSQDLRDRVLAACQAGELTQEQIAQRFQVSLRWVKKIWARYRTTGLTTPPPHGGSPTPKLTPAQTAQLSELVAKQPDATLGELAQGVGDPVGPSRICQVLQKLGRRRKKSLHATEQERQDVKQQRQAWRAEHQEVPVELTRSRFVDECGLHTDLTRLYGRAAPGQRVVEAVPAGHYCQTTLIGASGLDGRTAWSKIKTFLRKAKARTHAALAEAIKAALATVSAEDAKAWFEACGYRAHS